MNVEIIKWYEHIGVCIGLEINNCFKWILKACLEKREEWHLNEKSVIQSHFSVLTIP